MLGKLDISSYMIIIILYITSINYITCLLWITIVSHIFETWESVMWRQPFFLLAQNQDLLEHKSKHVTHDLGHLTGQPDFCCMFIIMCLLLCNNHVFIISGFWVNQQNLIWEQQRKHFENDLKLDIWREYKGIVKNKVMEKSVCFSSCTIYEESMLFYGGFLYNYNYILCCGLDLRAFLKTR